MLYVCIWDVVFSVYNVMRGAVGARVQYGKYGCFVMEMLYVCVLSASCGRNCEG